MKISVILEALTGSFETDMNRAAKTTQKRMKEIERTAVRAGKIIGTALIAASTAIAYGVKKSIDAADEAFKSAQKIGVTTQELTGLQYAAKLAGVENEALETSLIKLSKTMNDAAEGGKAAKTAFEALGVTVQNQDGSLRSSADVMKDVADRFAGMQDGARKAALAQDLFGRSGAQLIPLLNAGSAGIAELQAEAERLGITIDDKTGAAAERFNDNLTRLQGALTGVFNSIAADVLPYLERLSAEFVSDAKSGDTLTSSASGIVNAFKGVVLVSSLVINSLQAVGEYVIATARAMSFLGELTLKDLVGTPAMVLSNVGKAAISSAKDIKSAYQDAFTNSKKHVVDFTDALEFALGSANADFSVPRSVSSRVNPSVTDTTGGTRAAAGKRELAKAEKELTDTIGPQIEALQRQVLLLGMTEKQAQLTELALDGASQSQIAQASAAIDAIDRHKVALESAAEAQAEFQNILSEAEGVIDSNKTEVQKLEEQLRRLREAYDEGGAGAAAFLEAIQISEKQLATAQKEAEVGFFDIEKAADEAGRNIQDSFANSFKDVITGTKSVKDAFADMIQSIASELLSLATQQIANDLFKGADLGGLIGDIFGGMGGGFAAGGRPPVGRVAVVGENGPELFMPDVAGTIVPNSRIGGQTSIVQNFTIEAPRGSVGRATQQQVAAAAARGLRRADSRTN